MIRRSWIEVTLPAEERRPHVQVLQEENPAKGPTTMFMSASKDMS